MERDKEQLMYEIMGKISMSNAPIVFKGAMITQLILSEHGFDSTKRITKDVDSNWVGEPPSMDELVSSINNALGETRQYCYAEALRPYSNGRSAGINIIDRDTGKALFSMDVSMRPVYDVKTYYHGDIAIKGVLPDEVLADKISAMSTKAIYRRMKDVVDVYALSHCVELHSQTIFNINEAKGNKMGTFHEFCSCKPEVQHAYERLKNVTGKLDFEDIYTYAEKFIQPFLENSPVNKRWNSVAQSWDDLPMDKS